MLHYVPNHECGRVHRVFWHTLYTITGVQRIIVLTNVGAVRTMTTQLLWRRRALPTIERQRMCPAGSSVQSYGTAERDGIMSVAGVAKLTGKRTSSSTA